MSRAERKARAREDLRKIKEEWLEKMKADYTKTKDFEKSLRGLEVEVTLTINREPQKKSRYTQAFTGLTQHMHEVRARVAAEIKTS